MQWLHQPKKRRTIQQLERQIIRRYAYMFPKQDISQPFTPIVFGFEVGSGWCDLLENLFDIVARIDSNKTVVLDQVKEKFGQLRWYFHHEGHISNRDSELIYWVVNAAEDQSGLICEECGEQGKIITLGTWMYCRCKKCEKALRRKRSIWE